MSSQICPLHDGLDKKLDSLLMEISTLKAEVISLKAQNSNMDSILKFVVVPLIAILGAIFGIKTFTP